MEINPLGTTPTLVDGDLKMTESAAIIHYLATRYGPAHFACSQAEAE